MVNICCKKRVFNYNRFEEILRFRKSLYVLLSPKSRKLRLPFTLNTYVYVFSARNHRGNQFRCETGGV